MMHGQGALLFFNGDRSIDFRGPKGNGPFIGVVLNGPVRLFGALLLSIKPKLWLPVLILLYEMSFG